jgi:pyridoxal phosphate enzyme (YggS family)
VSSVGTDSIAGNLERVQERIDKARQRAGRKDGVTLVGVSKYVPVDRMEEAYRCGLRHFGENRVQEYESKRSQLSLTEAVFHLVGHLQSNKARRAAELFDCVDSLDSLRLAHKLDAAAREQGITLPVLVQVNVGDEESKFGVRPEELPELVEKIAPLEGLTLRGLMAIPPYLEPVENVRPYFRRLRRLAEGLARRHLPGVEMQELSMGMSHDFEVAIEEGATQVRVGTAIFGERPGLGVGQE